MKRHNDTRVPAMMMAAAIDRFGPPSALTRHELPVPKPGPGEVLIALETAGIGSWDTSVRDGSWRKPGRTRFPLVPGVDGAGTIVAIGARVRGLRIDDQVYAYEFANPQGGFYAEYAVAEAAHVSRVPKHLNIRDAGAAAATALTALQGLEALDLRPRQTILIFGATGAVGTLAIQFAAHRGATVIATASGPVATRLVRRLGATHVIDARRNESIDHLRDYAPDGLDCVLAFAGGKSLERCLDLVRSKGRVAYPHGIEPEPGKRSAFRLKSYDAVANAREFAKLNRQIAATKLRVPIAATYPLGKAAQAHRRLERGRVLGRLVLRVRRASR